MSAATITDRSVETSGEGNRLTEILEERLSHPATSPDFDLKKGVNEVLADVGLTSDDCGGGLSFRGLERRAHVRRSGSVYRGNAAWNLSGNDGPDRNVADSRL